MLFHPIGMAKPLRVQGAFVSDSEIEALADNVRNSYGTALYSDEIQSSIDQKDKPQGGGNNASESNDDEQDSDYEMIDAAAQLALEYKVDKYGDADRLLSAYPVRSAGPEDMLSIDDGADVVPVKGLSIVIDPKQDLNGYTKPWIGGSGKNLYTLKIGQDLFANNANATHTSTTEEMTIVMSDDISNLNYFVARSAPR